MQISAIVIITAALVFYSVGVWGERLQRTLKPWHVAAFLLGLTCDATGTFMMSRIAAANPGAVHRPLYSTMAFTGAIALALMAFHAGWALVVLLRNRTSEKQRFHVFSMGVWALWLIPYFTGAAGAMVK